MRVKVYVRNDNPEKNRIGVYKVYERTLHNTLDDGSGEDYVIINKQKAYVYVSDDNTATVRYWG